MTSKETTTMTNKQIVGKYILLKIILEVWKPGDKIDAASKISAKLNIGILTVKKTINLLTFSNVLITEEKKGVYVNPKIYDFIPGSLSNKYDFKFIDNKYIVSNEKIHKEYEYENQIVAIVDTELLNNIFQEAKYDSSKTFMFNLANNGFIVTSIESQLKLMTKNKIEYILELRNFYDYNGLLIAKEKIYILKKYFKQNLKYKFL